MLFNSLDFAVFFPIFFLLYLLVAKKLVLRNILILSGSYLFYGWWDWRFLSLIIFSSFVDYLVGLKVYKTSNKKLKKRWLFVSLISNLGLLFYFKYTNFFIESFVNSFTLFGANIESFSLNIILPVGISFYTFQTLSYTIDIYRGSLKPTKNILAFFSFVAFFPQLVAGPIERASHLLPQFFKIHEFNYRLFKSGLLLIAFGLFKKMVIADRLAILVNEIFNNPIDHMGLELIIGSLFFAFQIYCDFSGYSDIAIGISRTLGFDLMKNFDAPYLSSSITSFWRRWHISLSTWFRDYVYIPLGGSRVSNLLTYFNLFAVFVISGLWHGAAMTFIIWGAIHGAFIVFEKRLTNNTNQRKEKPKYKIFLSTLFTFMIVCFAWIFFRAKSLNDAFYIVSHLVDFKSNFEITNLGLEIHEFKLALASIILLLIFDAIHRKYNMIKIINKLHFTIRSLIYVSIILSILVFGVYGEEGVSEFIYFQF
ncbi:MAG: MBOAT family O-acyltransferase [Patiriisocius sp.]|uniref:MBOAT family O-acyltransferase n=1 Tax=Patiriisocius sp. TaxID=2822396 RepID=UPI003EF60E1E